MITLSSARNLVTKAMDKAVTDFKRPICITICDPYGFLVAFARMDGAPIRSIEISQRKALTAVRMGVSTDAFFARLQKDGLQAGYFGAEMLPLPGGSVLKDAAGAIAGGIGISGLAASEDHAISEAMAALVAAGRGE